MCARPSATKQRKDVLSHPRGGHPSGGYLPAAFSVSTQGVMDSLAVALITQPCRRFGRFRRVKSSQHSPAAQRRHGLAPPVRVGTARPNSRAPVGAALAPVSKRVEQAFRPAAPQQHAGCPICSRLMRAGGTALRGRRQTGWSRPLGLQATPQRTRLGAEVPPYSPIMTRSCPKRPARIHTFVRSTLQPRSGGMD